MGVPRALRMSSVSDLVAGWAVRDGEVRAQYALCEMESRCYGHSPLPEYVLSVC